jgi:hypothetical protein
VAGWAGEQGRCTWTSPQLCPETSWALTRNRLMENMSSAPSQGSGLGRALVGPADSWSLGEVREAGPLGLSPVPASISDLTGISVQMWQEGNSWLG